LDPAEKVTDVVRERARAGDLHIPSDNELAGRAARGDVAAFDELYRRHAEAAWRVGQAVAANPHDAADAVADAFVQIFQSLPLGRIDPGVPFRPYLLAATRNAAIDAVRRRARLHPTSELAALDTATPTPGPSERVEAGEDRALVAEAFRGLPERWRSVLWLTEVEGMPARDAAPVMGLSPNGVAQLALRARAGLRRNYLQAHVRNGVARRCRWTVDHLGAYVAGALARRDLAKIEQHLAGCEACRARLADLEDLGSTLRGVLLPIPLGLGAMALGKWRLTAYATHITRGAADPVRRALSGTSAALAVLGVLGLLLLPRVEDRHHGPVQRSPAVPTAPQTVQLTGAAPAPSVTPSAAGAQAAALLPGPAAFPLVPPGSGGGPPSAPPPTSPPPGPGPPGPMPPGGVPVVEVTLSGALGPAGAGAAAGVGDGSCTAIAFEPSADGCITTPRQDPGVRAEGSGQAFPQPVVISVP
jgi:RNA polymerase sigma factor (sigma-70 family)